jgi:hypothetical protein
MQRRALFKSLVLSITLAITSNAWATASEQVLHGFTGGADGAFPSSSLVMDAAGNLYGTTSEGGNPADCPSNFAPGCGVVFQLTFSNGKGNEKDKPGRFPAWSKTGLRATSKVADRELSRNYLVGIARGNQIKDADFRRGQSVIGGVFGQLEGCLRGHCLLPGMDRPDRVQEVLVQAIL